MLQWNYEHKLLTLGPQNFYHTSMETPEAKHKTPKPQNPKPKSQISCYNGTINIKPLAVGLQTFDHTSMVTPETKLKTLNPKRKFQSSTLNFNGLV